MGRFEDAEVFRDTDADVCAQLRVGDYLRVFRAIEFAVCCRPGDSANYDAFARKLVRHRDRI